MLLEDLAEGVVSLVGFANKNLDPSQLVGNLHAMVIRF
jgi:hypothetical protein